MNPDSTLDRQAVNDAMQLLNLKDPFNHEDLLTRYREACRKWYPARYAGHTNNPGKYMQMYKKGESKTKAIQSAFDLLHRFLENSKTTNLSE